MNPLSIHFFSSTPLHIFPKAVTFHYNNSKSSRRRVHLLVSYHRIWPFHTRTSLGTITRGYSWLLCVTILARVYIVHVVLKTSQYLQVAVSSSSRKGSLGSWLLAVFTDSYYPLQVYLTQGWPMNHFCLNCCEMNIDCLLFSEQLSVLLLLFPRSYFVFTFTNQWYN